MSTHEDARPQGTLWQALTVFLVVLIILMYGILSLNSGAHIPLLCATTIVILYGHFCLKIPLSELESCIVEAAKGVPFLILLSVGMLIAAWMLCGTVPYLVYIGLRSISPALFLPLVLIICAILSTATGSSWMTCGMIGVAFLGISMGLGIPSGMTVAGIVSGCFFGDKQSYLSDFPVFCYRRDWGGHDTPHSLHTLYTWHGTADSLWYFSGIRLGIPQ